MIGMNIYTILFTYCMAYQITTIHWQYVHKTTKCEMEWVGWTFTQYYLLIVWHIELPPFIPYSNWYGDFSHQCPLYILPTMLTNQTTIIDLMRTFTFHITELEKLEENHLEAIDIMAAIQWTKPFGPITITIPKISS
jgi:hypothetical protein